MTPLPRVSDTHASIRAALARRLVRVGLWAGAAALGVVLVLARVLAGSGGWGPRARGPLLLDLALVAAGAAIWILARRVGATRIREQDVSGAIEGAAGLGAGEVQGVLELERTLPEGVSPSLARRHASAVADSLSRPSGTSSDGGREHRLAGSLGEELQSWERRAGGAAAAIAVILAGVVALGPSTALGSWAGLVRPIGLWTGPTLPALSVQPGDIEIPRGSDVEILISAPLRNGVTLSWQAAGDISRSAELAVGAEGAASWLFERVSAEIRYSITSPDGASSDEYVIQPVDPLFVADVRLSLRYPAYLDRGTEELRGEVDVVTVPEGTRIGVSGLGSRPVAEARLINSSGASVELGVDGSGFEGEFLPRGSQLWSWAFLDARGDSAALVPQPFRVVVVPDSAPSVDVLAPAPDTVLPLDLRQPLTIRARDDHGLRALELVAWRVNALGEPQPERRQVLDLGGVGAVLVPPVLDVSDWELVAGDEVRYRVIVRDIHPDARIAQTGERVLRMPTAEEMRQQATSQMEETARALEALQEEAEMSAEAARDLARQQAAPEREGQQFDPAGAPDESFGEQEDVRQALEDQQALMDEAARMAEELQALQEALQEAGASDADLAQDLREMESLLDDLGGEDAAQRMQEMMDQLSEAGETARQRTLDELTADQESFRDRIEEALDRLEQAAMEQDLRNAASETERMADQERALADALEEGGDAEDLAARQEELLADAEATAERMQDLADRMAERGDLDASQQLEEAIAAGEVAQQGMQSAQQMAQQGQQQAAAEQAQAASEALDEQAEALRNAQQERMQEQAEAYQRALTQTSEDALALAREQERVRDQVETAGSPAERQRARAEMSAVYEGADNLTQRMEIAQRVAGQSDHELSSRLGIALDRIDEALQAIADGASPRAGAAEADQAIDALNQVALASLAAQRALEQGGSSEPQDAMEQLEELAQQQADVNNQASEMMPMPMPQQTRQEQMQQMAQQQQQIAADLGQMSNQEGDEGPLADLKSLGAEAEAIARELEQGRLEPETRERQERLFHRLLDAGRSLEKDEESTERESDEVTGFDSAEIPGLTDAALGLSRFGLPDAAALNRLSPAMRALVRGYFQRLNGGDGAAGRTVPPVIPPEIPPPAGSGR